LCGSVIEAKYRVDSLVGQGGHSYVYRAEHLALQAPVAIKFLKPDTSHSEDELLRSEAFLEEGRLLFRACSLHPAVVQLKDCGSVCTPQGSVPFLVMEWLDGNTLADEIASRNASEGNRTLQQALSTFAPVAECLGVLHASGITHRDIKPGNLIEVPVSVATPIKLADFGIAKWTPTDQPCASTSGLKLTPQFAAPEQWSRRLGKTGPWTDVYSFALCVMHWMAGHKSDLATWDHVTTTLDPGHRPTPRHYGLELPSPVERVFERAVSLSPQARYPTAMEFWTALTDAAGTRARPRGSSVRTLVIATSASAFAAALLAGIIHSRAIASPARAAGTASIPSPEPSMARPLDPLASAAVEPSPPEPQESSAAPPRPASRGNHGVEPKHRTNALGGSAPVARTTTSSSPLPPTSSPAPADILQSRTGPL